MPRIVGPKSLIKPLLPNGQPNPLFPLVTYASIRGLSVTIEGGLAIIDNITDLDDLDLQTMAGVVLAGAEVLGYPAWIAVPVADLSDPVPELLPHATADGSAVTWGDWHDANHAHTVVGDVAYVASDAWGDSLPGSSLVALLGLGYAIKTLAEMQSIVAAPE